MAQPEVVVPFDPNDNTAKADFTIPADTSVLKDQNVLVTGGASGLGLLLSRELASHGAIVNILDINVQVGESIATELTGKGYRAHFVHADVCSWDSLLAAFKSAIRNAPSQTLDIVILCAGIAGTAFPTPPPGTVTLDSADDPPVPTLKTIHVNLTGVYYSALLALHYFQLPPTSAQLARKKQLIFVGSLASYVEIPPMVDYNATKFGVRGIFKAIRRDVRAVGVRTNLIAPTFLAGTMMLDKVEKALQGLGATLAPLEKAVEGIMKVACTEEIDGRAIGIGGRGNFDLRDDPEGLDAGTETLQYFTSGQFGGGMHTFREVLGGRGF